MKTIAEIFRTIYALVAGFLASLAIGVFAVLILDKNRDILGIVSTGLIALFALYVGYQVYRMVRRRGILSFVTAVSASPDMDNLESSDKRVREVNAERFVSSVNSGKGFFKGGCIRIWGDWKGRQLESKHMLKEAQYSEAEKLLKITFNDLSQVYIWNPKRIMESDTFLKILGADNIRWKWKSEDMQEDYFYDYRMESGEIVTWTNSTWKGEGMDTLIGESALFMQKK